MADGSSPVSRIGVVVFGIYLVALNLVLAYLLLQFWPGAIPIEAKQVTVGLWTGGPTFQMGVETLYLVLAGLSGALGSYVHLATSFADYVGNRQFVSSWTWWYVLRPFIGLALAVIVAVPVS